MDDEPKSPDEVGKTKHAGGRPRTKSPETVSAEMLKQIDEYAEAQCKDNAIAEALGWDANTFKRQFEARCRQKRAIGKTKVWMAQYRGCFARGKGAVTERVWFGKQNLEQTDKQDIEHSGTISVNTVSFKDDSHGNGNSTTPK